MSKWDAYLSIAEAWKLDHKDLYILTLSLYKTVAIFRVERNLQSITVELQVPVTIK